MDHLYLRTITDGTGRILLRGHDRSVDLDDNVWKGIAKPLQKDSGRQPFFPRYLVTVVDADHGYHSRAQHLMGAGLSWLQILFHHGHHIGEIDA